MSENKTKPTSVSVDEFLSTVSEQRQQEARALIALMTKISGEPAVMWGPSIIGFGLQHYKSEAGREGDMGLLGFSPRKASLTVYFYEGFNHYGRELEILGKHKTSQGCLYINKLADVDMKVLESMIASSYKMATSKIADKPETVEAYVASVPKNARKTFDELRTIARNAIPEAQEALSYGMVAYKYDLKKRGIVFVSGWKDHVALYPIPKDEALREKLAPYIRGKGTLWFPLDQPLPKTLIIETVRALA